MFSSEDLAKKIKVVADGARSVETNTSLNNFVEYIVRECFVILNNEYKNDFEILNLSVQTLAAALSTRTFHDDMDLVLEHLDNMDIKEHINNGSKDGGISVPKRSTETPDEGPRIAPRTRKTSRSNALA